MCAAGQVGTSKSNPIEVTLTQVSKGIFQNGSTIVDVDKYLLRTKLGEYDLHDGPKKDELSNSKFFITKVEDGKLVYSIEIEVMKRTAVLSYSSEEAYDVYAHPSYVTTYLPIAGWKAVLMCWDDDCNCYTPWQTGYFAYKTEAEAIADAKYWAESEDIDYRPRA